MINNNHYIKKGKFTLKSDSNGPSFEQMLKASNETGQKIKFAGDRIVDFQIEGLNNEMVNIKPDLLTIGPQSEYFDIKLGNLQFNNQPFDRIFINDNLKFTSSSYSSMPIQMIFQTKREHGNIFKNTFLIKPLSNDVQDILEYELIKKELNANEYSIVYNKNNSLKISGFAPEVDNNDNIIKFFTKVCEISDLLHKKIFVPEDYIITNNDSIICENILKALHNKKLEYENISLNLYVNLNQLKEFIDGEGKEILIIKDPFYIKLLGNKINMGKCKIFISESKFVNKSELINIYETNQNNDNSMDIVVVIVNKDSNNVVFDFPNLIKQK